MDMASRVPNLDMSAFQNSDVNLESRSDTITRGIPWSFTTVSKNRAAVSGALSVFFVGTKCTRLVNLSTTIRIMFQSPSPEGMNGPAKSMVTVCHLLGGTCKGCRRPLGLPLVRALFLWQTVQLWQYVRTSRARLFQKYR